MKCGGCGKDINATRMAGIWPGHFSCKYCKKTYSANYGHLIGLIYFPILFILQILPIFIVAAMTELIVNDGLYQSNPVQMITVLVGPITVYFVVAPIYSRFLINKVGVNAK